ncbi:MAG: LemA family protein [Bacteroidota bacterium]
MKKGTIIILAIIGLVIVAFMWGSGIYNNMVELEEGVNSQWSNVENVYQRRADLIPNLVNTVKGYAAHEKETLEAVIKARSEATSVKIDPSNMKPGDMKQFQAAQDNLSGALSKLMVVVEKYPDLKANQNFLELQAQLEGTENRIAVERRKYNETVEVYNKTIRRFPNNVVNMFLGFEKKEYFEASEGAEKAPEVKF